MAKPRCFTSIKHKPAGETASAKGLLKYLQHRRGSVRREAYLSGEYKDWKDIPKDIKDQAFDAKSKWTDRGLGSDYKNIAQQLDDWQGRQVLMRHWVISPDSNLMQHVPEDKRFEMVSRIADATVHDWYEANGWGVPQYSYVLHDKMNKEGLPMPHAHIVTPGTIDLGPHGRIDHYVRKPHIRNLHEISQAHFERELEHTLGKDRAQSLITERDNEVALERHRKTHHHPNLDKKRALFDVAQLLKAEEERKKDEKEHRKRQRKKVDAVHMRAYLHRIREEQRSERQQEYLAKEYDDEIDYRTDLAALGQEQAERVQAVTEKEYPMLTHGQRQQRQARRQEIEEERQHADRMRRLGNDILNSPEVARAVLAIAQAQKQTHNRDVPEH